ncbi:MAG: competence/damage-inducible protein A [Calditrichaeota bacterium]|nr:MAG: competence/damage-inducible protein A [Calditrichota bacterium]
MQAVIISIGNELLNGKTVNSNATFIGGKLYEIGIPTREIVAVGDDGEQIQAALRRALEQAEVVILTGGLGPTHDDITKKTVAEFFGASLVFNEAILKKVEERFRRRGMTMPEINRNQALVPEKARLLDNPVGTAPGMHFQQEGKHVFVLPGVPREMKAIMEGSVIPFLEQQTGMTAPEVHFYRTTGIAESKLYEKLADLLEAYPYEVAFLPKFTGVDMRIVVRGDSPAKGKYPEFEKALYARAGQYIYATEEKELEAVIGEMLRERGLTLAVAESCTGGLLQDKITNVPGSSEYFMGGMVTYSNESKMKFLGVKETSLREHGAVSEVVAKEMAEGVRRAVGTDVALSTTGIAGPTGATPQKPVGLIYIGLATAEKVVARKFVLTQDRRLNKELGAQLALDLLRRDLLGLKTGAE